MKKICIIGAAALLLSQTAVTERPHVSTQGHYGEVSAMAGDPNAPLAEPAFFSAGIDGFLTRWTSYGMGERFQVSDREIKFVARHPNGTEVAVCESDGISADRVSVWDWGSLTRKFSAELPSPAAALAYSSRGTYLVASVSGEEGAVFFNSKSGQIEKKIARPAGAATFAKTSETENSLALYSPEGRVSYFNLQTGELKTTIPVEPGLRQVGLWGAGSKRSVFLSGCKDGFFYAIDSTDGRTLARLPAEDGIIHYSGAAESDFLYFSRTSGKHTVVDRISQSALILAEGGAERKAPAAEEVMRIGRPKDDHARAGILFGGSLAFGTKGGQVYTAKIINSFQSDAHLPLSKDAYQRVLDIDVRDNEFFFLTEGLVCRSGPSAKSISKVCGNSDATDMILYGRDRLILWSRNSGRPVTLYDMKSGRSEPLFAPYGTLQRLRLFGNTLVCVQNGSQVRAFDIGERKMTEVYEGSRVTDAILLAGGICVARQEDESLPSSLIMVNAETGSTEALPSPGRLTSAICYDDKSGRIFGLAEDGEGSFLFSLEPSYKAIERLSRSGESGYEGLLSADNGLLFSNLGGAGIRTREGADGAGLLLERGAGLPKKAARLAGKIAVLNKDGSISWFSHGFPQPTEEWRLGTDGKWIVF